MHIPSNDLKRPATPATRRAFLGGLGLAAAGRSVRGASKLRVMTTTEDLAALTAEIGGDRVSVESISRGYQDPHYVEPKPSFILKLSRTDLLIVVGLGLEIAWLPPLITQSRNRKIQRSTGYLDASQFAEILERPTGPVSRAAGDIHPQGNPHYWLDPANGRRIARGIQSKLGELMPDAAAYFSRRFADFDARLTEAEKRWNRKMAPYQHHRVVTYHRTWPNFARRFGIEVAGYVEPLPGIPPSPRHTLSLIQQMKSEDVKLIWVEPYFNIRTPNRIAQNVGGEAIVVYPSVGGRKEITDYFSLFDYDIGLITKAFDRLGQGSG